MSRSLFFRLFPFLCAIIAFHECLLPVKAVSQPHLPEYGPWGPWTETSECSRTCGGGITHQDRICMDTRLDGRHPCVGRSRRYFFCNVQDCPPGSKDFRAAQCARFNNVLYKDRYYSWLSYHHPNSPCELYCTPKGGNFYQKADSKVIDGTKCRNDGSLDVCVDGQCMPVGCDKILGSTTQEDECRVCGGDGSNCSVVKGVFDEDKFEIGYNDILLIPAGATSILIQKVEPTRNFLAVRNSEEKFYLNGNWKIEFPKEIRFAGTVFQYERKSNQASPETLKSRGPTSEDIFIMLLYQSKNLGIDYEYFVPITTRAPAPDSYIWTTGEFEECSKACGGGVQYRTVRCFRESDRDITDDRLCDSQTKPEANGTCNNEPCPESWKIGEWSECTQKCDGGTQFRVIYCHQQKDGNIVLAPDERCEQPKPLFMRSCNLDKECPQWTTREWSECDSPCGSGSQNRSVECYLKDTNEVLDDSHCDGKKPDEVQRCNLGPCEGVEWIVSDWSGCDGSCSLRIESRRVHCANEEGDVFPNDACDVSKMPELTRPCPKADMCDPMWHVTDWTECSVPCGGGERTRDILCFQGDDVVDSSQCNPNQEPSDKEFCNMAPCDDVDSNAIQEPHGIESSKEDCYSRKFGCCPDGLTPASGPEQEGCEDTKNTTHCRRRLDGEGCEPINCTYSAFGCCSDNVTASLGPGGEGCVPEDCSNSTFGCCSDNVTIALGLNGEGCGFEDCTNNTYGCCPDNFTIALGPDGEGCVPDFCSNSTYGCCPDNVTVALGPNNEGCEIENCQNTTYGRCPDNITVASGPSKTGCEPTTDAIPECVNTQFGCCPDETTIALGLSLEGCCFGMRYGCCPDNITVALGPIYLGCRCQTYPFGCCPDDITAAQGPNFLGCICENTRYGCCQDQLTPAKGYYFEGCVCQFMYYGCCPDGVTPIVNDRGEGCGCDSTRYGCCPDGKTAAVSADLSGCPCETLPYGCCPDGHTPARTSDLRDCPCEAHRYGCCLDGRTISKGPNYEGCPCDSTRFGCCMDGKTTAQGPGFEGCPCETTRYGCCADGYTIASGPRYEGCPDVLQPKPKVSTEVCSLPKEAGPCRNFTVKWFFDMAYGGCSRFWYGGCDGNGNVFATQDECEGVCVKPEGPEACLLPMVTGSCDGKVPSWYFDAGSKKCETFTYGGCLGNNNRFVTKTDCEAKCIRQQTIKPVDKCSLPKDEGGCDSAIIKWYYNGENERCEQFYYGGCKGNANRFESRRECEKSCMSSVIKETDICRLPHEIGPCNEFRERWYFDYESAQCHRFIFGGCDGNENNFASFQECEKRCGKDTASEPPTDIEFKTDYCFQLQDAGPCSSSEVNWHYDSSDGVCKEFYYGGCKGNRNRFKTRKECETSCFKAQDACSLAVVKGSCSGSFTQWYYDETRDDCYEFSFSGCQGNANRFNSKDSCYQRCKKAPVTAETPDVTSDVCSLSQEPGPCLGYYRMWYYDNSDNACKSFVYGGCDGNGNRFEKRRECEQRCVKKSPKGPVTSLPDTTRSANEDVCRLPVDPGPCNEDHPRWFYDAQTQSCLPFVYGGCEGNKNRFKTAEICLRFCTGIKAKTSREEIPQVTPTTTTTTTPMPTSTCPPSNCAEIRCPFGIEESFDTTGCSSCRCSNPCEVHVCPEGSRCAIDVVRTSREGVRTEPVCRRVQKPGLCPSSSFSSGPRDCETRCRDDADCRGEYKCCNNGCAFTCMPPSDDIPLVPATQPEPARILPGVNVTKGTIGEPAELPCNAVGSPKPTVTWWRETTMLPLSSRRYEQLPNYALLIRSVVYEDGGDYSCHAHNGIGSGATYRVTLIIDLQVDVPPSSRGEETDFSSRDSEPESPVEPSKSPWDDVPVSAAVTLLTSSPRAGSPLEMDCVTEGPPETKVTWQYNNAQLVIDDRRRILSNHTLFITKADVSDTGEYKCVAQYGNNVATSSVYVAVIAVPTESTCVDNPQFNNCNLIVKANYCNNKIYRAYCCGSCMKAGL